MTAEDLVHVRRQIEYMVHVRENPNNLYFASLGQCGRCANKTSYMAIPYCDECQLALLKIMETHFKIVSPS